MQNKNEAFNPLFIETSPEYQVIIEVTYLSILFSSRRLEGPTAVAPLASPFNPLFIETSYSQAYSSQNLLAFNPLFIETGVQQTQPQQPVQTFNPLFIETERFNVRIKRVEHAFQSSFHRDDFDNCIISFINASTFNPLFIETTNTSMP